MFYLLVGEQKNDPGFRVDQFTQILVHLVRVFRVTYLYFAQLNKSATTKGNTAERRTQIRFPIVYACRVCDTFLFHASDKTCDAGC